MHGRHHQRGAAALTVTLLLAVAMFVVVAALQRAVTVEQRIGAQQRDSVAAFHAAEAGIDWALARLNDPTPLRSDDCSMAGAGASFAQRHLGTTLVAACVRDGGAWSCGCGLPASSTAGDIDTGRPAFDVRFEPTARADVFGLIATGRAGGVADARSEIGVARLGAITSAPAAALTARGAIVAGAATLGAHNADAVSGGLALHAGAAIDASAARIEPPGGMARADAVLALDPMLSARSTDAFFAATFGLDPATWAARPGVQRIECGAGDCATAVRDAAQRHRMIQIDGDLQLDGPVELGTPAQPVVIVVAGTARLRGAVAVHGLLHAGSIEWNGASAPAARIVGAAITAGDYRGDASADIVRDAAVLQRLRSELGSWVRVPGSWRDFF